jgi:hypothetical protein
MINPDRSILLRELIVCDKSHSSIAKGGSRADCSYLATGRASAVWTSCGLAPVVMKWEEMKYGSLGVEVSCCKLREPVSAVECIGIREKQRWRWGHERGSDFSRDSK